MMTEHEIRETFDLEWQLAKILLKKRHWIHQFKTLEISTQAKYNKVNKTGTIRIAQERYGERDYKQLRIDIKEMLVDLCSGFQPRDKYLWQVVAKDLNLIPDITADDMCECTLCGNYTVLTHYKLCVDCHNINKAVRSNPGIARKVLNLMEQGK
jgi:hypothetical protein